MKSSNLATGAGAGDCLAGLMQTVGAFRDVELISDGPMRRRYSKKSITFGILNVSDKMKN